jgi:hypothetical protein
MGILLADREFYPKPVGFTLCLANRNYRQINHAAKIGKKSESPESPKVRKKEFT